MARNRGVEVPLDINEKEIVEKRAARLGLKIATYLRLIALNSEVSINTKISR